MRNKQLLIISVALMLILPSFLVHADTAGDSEPSRAAKANETGEWAAKDEVVYATLEANGDLNEVYVVNILDVVKEGTVVDYGNYDHIKNLTNLSEMEHKEDSISVNAPKGKFYYQGNMAYAQLPWNIDITYLLDGAKIEPAELAGKNGHVEIFIQTTANGDSNPDFYNNYMLQVSLSLDTQNFSQIVTEGGMIANAGKNKQITFTVMPGKDGELRVAADVENFELDGIDIAAVPSAMTIDAPDLENMNDDMQSLSDAIGEINKGVSELLNGVAELNDGVIELRNGSKAYKDGLNELNEGSGKLAEASKLINDALAAISGSLRENSGEMDVTSLSSLPPVLTQFAENLDSISGGLEVLRGSYSDLNTILDGAIMQIPDHTVTPEEIEALYSSGADPAVVKKLTETYAAAMQAKGTYLAVKEGFDTIDAKLQETSEGIYQLGHGLTLTADEISSSLENMEGADSLLELEAALSDLSANYKEFHSGLVDYTNGVGLLSDSYGEMHNGIVDLSNGTGELKDGVQELNDGTQKLYEATSDLPDQMQDEIDAMISDFDKSDFQPISFVSPNNKKINSVQFVIKTASIKNEKQEKEEEYKEEEKSFWTLFLDLFS